VNIRCLRSPGANTTAIGRNSTAIVVIGAFVLFVAAFLGG